MVIPKTSKKNNINALRKALVNEKLSSRMYPTNITRYKKAGIKPEKGKKPNLLNSYYKPLNDFIKRMEQKEKKEALGYYPIVPKFNNNLSSLKLFGGNGNNNNNATSLSNSQVKSLKLTILDKIYKYSLTQTNKKSCVVLYKFFDDLNVPQIRKFTKFIKNNTLLTYIENATDAISKKTTKKLGDKEVSIVFNKKQLITFVVLMWLDSIHDGYYGNTLIKALYDDKTSIFLKHLDILTKPVRDELISAIQTNWGKVTVLKQLVDSKSISVLKKNGKTDFSAEKGKFEAFLKNNISEIFGAPKPIILGHTTLLTSDIDIRLNIAIDQSDGRIPDTLLASQYAKIPNNKLKIYTTLTIAGLVDPGRFFLTQRMGVTSLLSGLFKIDEPSINGKIVMDDIKFVFYYKSNKNNINNKNKYLFTANYNLEPRTTGGSTIDIITLNLKTKDGAVQLRPGTTAKEGDITKFFGDFYQVLINNAYNINRQGKSYYTMGSGDGVMIAMNTFMSGVMGAPIAMFVDSGKVTESFTNQTQPVKVYLPSDVSGHLQAISDISSPTFTDRNNRNNNNNKNVVSSNVPIRPTTIKRPANSINMTGESNNNPPLLPKVAWVNKKQPSLKTPRGKRRTASIKPLKTPRGRSLTATAKPKPMTARTATAKPKSKPMTARTTTANSMNITPNKRKRPSSAFTAMKKQKSSPLYNSLF